MTDVGCVQSPWRHPVRSMRDEELASAGVAARGVVGDRCYCVVDVEQRRAAEASYVPQRWGGLLAAASLTRASSLYPEGHFAPARFRPNVVLDTGSAEGFVESGWVGRTLALGSELRLELSEPCAMTTLPQAELLREPRILKTLHAHNSGYMGVYARVVRRGDRAELL